MTKFKFDIIKSQQVCETMLIKQKSYQNTADNLYREVINSKNAWFDLASDTFNRRAQKDYASLIDALDSINKYYNNLKDFTTGMHDIFLSRAEKDSRGVIDYDSPYITLAKEKITLIISYLNSALESLRTSIPTDFDKAKNIREISEGVSVIAKDIEYLSSKLREIEQSVEKLIVVHKNKERAIEFINIDSNVTRFNWTVVPVSKKINPNIIRVVTYDKVAPAPKVNSTELNMQTANKFTTEGNATIEANNESVTNTVNSDEHNNTISSVDINSSDRENMQVTSDMTLSIGPVDNASTNSSNMQVTSDMTISIGSVDSKASGTNINSSENISMSTNSVNTASLNANVSSVAAKDINTSSVSSNIGDTNMLKTSDSNITINSIENNIVSNSGMQQSTNSDIAINAVKSNSSGVNLTHATDSSITTSNIESSVSSSNMQHSTSTDTVINEVKNSINPNAN